MRGVNAGVWLAGDDGWADMRAEYESRVGFAAKPNRVETPLLLDQRRDSWKAPKLMGSERSLCAAVLCRSGRERDAK